MADTMAEIRAGERFAFGSNWKAFIDLVDDARIDAAVASLRGALRGVELAGRTFLDVGCGSGLFSLAAHRLGARVHSFDFDAESVAATAELRRRFGGDGDWTIEQGSILDEDLVAGLGRFDVVYSWGVLHHTGDLWRALDLVTRLVAPGGSLFISIYNDQGLQSRVWRVIKRRYNASGALTRRALVGGSAVYFGARRSVVRVARLTGPIRGDGPRPRPRGMSGRHDLVDWVGGYPFEVAKPEQVFGFLRDRGYELRHLTTCGGGIGCNEFVFERTRPSSAGSRRPDHP
jgi:2-polyprenyl-6-hydroxyphenyl methylase/3-demethylubiquinone-9 3-methyltransferase